ncbi:G-protein coupled receptor 143-like isoform X2 [Anthonomus grandis grandis]|uniref:G-protein coupled receptor 143-like isoform X2 n=1 Tax=Anthonomus grandis grandis TaxID=2921223 RepID=UPI002165F105|nr:G-protein coupled receptor 143-like isoform X2 [Anthonomus grandis grandis]
MLTAILLNRAYKINLEVLPRTEFANSHRWLSFSAERGRKIIVWLAVSDLMAAVGVFTRSAIWITRKNIMPAVEDDSSVLFCAISSALIQYFYTASWIWTLCYAIDMRHILNQRELQIGHYHLIAWALPAVLTSTGLLLLYFPDANCHTVASLSTALLRILPNYLVTYIPMLTVMVYCPILYHNSIQDMKTIISSTSGQFTSRERDIMEAVKIKFFVINLVFYVCWMPNLVNFLMLWTLWFRLPAEFMILVWYIMAFTNPLQAFFNALVYRRWSAGSEKLALPWRHYQVAEYQLTRSISSDTSREEIYPLLQNSPSKSVNGYKSLH